MEPQLNTISRVTATRWVQNWLVYAKEKLGFRPGATPKSIFIPASDVEQAIHGFQKLDPLHRKASGIRIYFTIRGEMNNEADPLYLSCIVVPTVMTDRIDETNGKPIHQDVILKIPALRKSVGAALARDPGDGGGGGDSETIYDFTSPCPPYCNGTTDWQ